MNDKFAVVLLMALLPCVSYAEGSENYLCTHGTLQRRVEILSEPGVAVPCEVHYYKDTEADDERQVLWRALNEAGYCERKTQEFIVKLHNLGWTCGRHSDSADNDEPKSAENGAAETKAEVIIR